MKKNIKRLMVFPLAVLTLVACSHDDEVVNEKETIDTEEVSASAIPVGALQNPVKENQKISFTDEFQGIEGVSLEMLLSKEVIEGQEVKKRLPEVTLEDSEELVMVKFRLDVINTKEVFYVDLNEVLTILTPEGIESGQKLLGETKASIYRWDDQIFVVYLIREKNEKTFLRYSASLGNQIIFELENENYEIEETKNE